MLQLFGFLILGYVIGIGIDWIRLPGFSFKEKLKELVVSVFIFLVASFFLGKAGLNGWLTYAILVAVGFLWFHVLAFLIKKRS